MRVDLDALHALDALLGRRALRVADRDPGRDAHLAREHRHRRGEVHAVPGLRLEELGDHVEPAAVVALLDGRLRGVVEVGAAEVRLDRDRRVVRRWGARGDGCRGVGDDLRAAPRAVRGTAASSSGRSRSALRSCAGVGSTSRRVTRYCCPSVFVSTLRTVSEPSSQNQEPSEPVDARRGVRHGQPGRAAPRRRSRRSDAPTSSTRPERPSGRGIASTVLSPSTARSVALQTSPSNRSSVRSVKYGRSPSRAR